MRLGFYTNLRIKKHRGIDGIFYINYQLYQIEAQSRERWELKA